MEIDTSHSFYDDGEASIPTPFTQAPKKRANPKDVILKITPKLRSGMLYIIISSAADRSLQACRSKKMLVDEDDLYPASYTKSTSAPTASDANSNGKRTCDDNDLLETIVKSRNELRNIQRQKALIEEKEKKLLKAQEVEVEKFNKTYDEKTPWELYELFCGK